ncbi:hypothetical protein RHSIM_Rhsim06G0088900 [Rhododendron simsii]|uniref:Uncharacterized protein n=1 Tax=Rhododendron simsii TaxID=118357 RepID=A0A834GTN5_RHOSS|nr:hypothetical protein RHSIM_Rhsim06G0088900 [Rhododendron simsii]
MRRDEDNFYAVLLDSTIDNTVPSLHPENPEKEYPPVVDLDSHIHLEAARTALLMAGQRTTEPKTQKQKKMLKRQVLAPNRLCADLYGGGGVAKLIHQHALDFRLEDFFGIYFVGQNAQSRKCYLSCRPKQTPLFLDLPDKDDLKDELIVGGTGNLGVADRLKAKANAKRKSWAYTSPERTAPKLLGYIPSYNTTFVARTRSQAARTKRITEAGLSSMEPNALHPLGGHIREPIDRDTPTLFSEGSSQMPRTPLHLVDLEDTGTTAADAC